MARKRIVFLPKLQSILKYFLVGISLTLVIGLGQTPVQASLPLLSRLSSTVTPINRVITAQATTAPQLVQQGRVFYEAGQFEQALITWQKAADAYTQINDQTGITGSLINQAQALSALGLSRRACQTLTQALKVDDGICDANQKAQPLPKQKPSLLINTGLRTLGDVLRIIGNFEKSQEVLLQNWEIAQQLSSPEAEGDTLLSLGNTARFLGNRERDLQDTLSDKPFIFPTTSLDCTSQPSIVKTTEAIGYYQQALKLYQQATACYQQSASTSTSRLPPIQAQLNRLSLLIEIEQWLRKHQQQLEADSWSAQIQPQMTQLLKIQPAVANLPRSHEAIYGKINFVRSLTLFSLKQGFDSNNSSWKNINQLLHDAIQQAKDLGDKQASAYAVGNLGWMYEQTGQLSEALESTQQALKLAKEIKAQEIVYQWEWQLGRILINQKQPDIKGARAAYERAVNALQSIRKGLTAVNKDAQFSFRDDVEPLYRQLVNLVLTTEKTSELSLDNLKQAIKQIDELQLAELENFLGCRLSNLVQSKPISPIEQVTNQSEQVTKNKAALIYPIILEDRISLLFKLPNQPLKHFETLISQQEVKKKLRKLRDDLIVQGVDIDDVNKLAEEVYGWLFRPIEESLKKNHDVETLVFVLDGELRNIPMAVLYDGKEYLVQKNYDIAVAPSLQLIEPKPRVGKLKVLLGGIEKYPKDGIFSFPDLKIEKEQLQLIQKEVDASEILLNSKFTKNNLQLQLKFNQFSAVHLATHGKFSSNPEETFIAGYKELIKANDLQELIQSSSNSIELLVLSACETAQGDNRAILGLAGLAVQSGAGSTLSTLWSAPTAPTNQLVVQFYKELSNPGVSRAKALHLAQKALFDSYYDAPYSWASYTLVGNWL